ncbi:MAG TPA: GNAT family N-acetyltransferase, partial [Candidatus Limnocylindrales bacterium]
MVDIRPLTPERFADLATLFEEGGDPKWCWCMYWRVRASEMSLSSGPQNRERLAGLAAHDPPAGLVAFDDDDRAVGWVSVGPREDYVRLDRSRTRPRVDDVPVWSIVCFVVARRARGQGLAARLLAAAVDHARARGAPAVEAFPVDTSRGRPTPATLYAGTLSTFL